MSLEREILIAVLKLTKNGPVDQTVVGRSARVPAQTSVKLLQQLADQALIRCTGKIVEAFPDQRVRMAVRAIELGTDFERVCSTLEWKEFESISTEAFEVNDYLVMKNFRFKQKCGKRWEIDLLAFKQPLIVAVDCKHWQHKWTRAPVVATVELHVERTKAFSDALPYVHDKIGLGRWDHATVLPIILSLLPAPFKFHHNTPIVAALQLQSFLSELPGHAGSLTRFQQKIPIRNKQITEFSQIESREKCLKTE